MKFGGSLICQNYFRSPRPDHEIYAEDLALAEMYEDLGFDMVWSVEHHFTDYELIPDPVQMLSYVCGRTKKIGLGTFVIVLPWHDPVRVAEQIAMLDNFARGRELLLGFGRGAAQVEYDGFRVSMSEARERLIESIEVVKRGLGQDRFSFAGKYFNIPDMRIRPRPVSSDLTERMYGAIISPETGEIMARAGLGMLIIPQKSWADHLKDYEAYQTACARFGTAVRRPIITAWIYCAEDESAQEDGRKWIMDYADTAVQHYAFDEPEHFRAAKGYEAYVELAQASQQQANAFQQEFAKTQIFGTPEQCVAAIRELRQAMNPSQFVGVFKYGSLPNDLAVRSTELFASQVMPAIRADGATAQEQSAAAL